MIGLEYSGNVVFNKILPFLTKYEEWLFWKHNHFLAAQKIGVIYKNEGHLTKKGLELIVNILYNKPNKYSKPKEHWMSLINKRIWK